MVLRAADGSNSMCLQPKKKSVAGTGSEPSYRLNHSSMATKIKFGFSKYTFVCMRAWNVKSLRTLRATLSSITHDTHCMCVMCDRGKNTQERSPPSILTV